nr:enoyl-CoA hydratase/isomerase family protein [Rhodococcus fascians]
MTSTQMCGVGPDVQVSIDSGVGTILLDRPSRMNSVTVSLAQQLEAALTELSTRANVDVVVIRGAGGNFSAGGDFDEVKLLRSQGTDALANLFEAFARALGVIEGMRQPVISAVEGVAMAGGFELMQASDIVLVHPDVRVRDTHIRFGWIPGGGSTQRLPRIVGRQQALGHLLSGDTLDANDLVRLGIAYRILGASTFDTDIDAFALALAGRDRRAVARIKELVALSFTTCLGDGLAAERAAVVDHIAGPSGQAGVTAFERRT